MSHVAQEFIQYGGLAEVEGAPVSFAEWIVIFKEVLAALKELCPNRFTSQEAYEAGFSAQHRKLRLKGQKDCCPMLVRPKLKKRGIRGKAAQDEWFFRTVMAANGYTLAEINEIETVDPVQEV